MESKKYEITAWPKQMGVDSVATLQREWTKDQRFGQQILEPIFGLVTEIADGDCARGRVIAALCKLQRFLLRKGRCLLAESELSDRLRLMGQSAIVECMDVARITKRQAGVVWDTQGVIDYLNKGRRGRKRLPDIIRDSAEMNDNG
ncbi:MAG TPA: hypothetical protein VEL76_00735 [Gemmataceae bacterium]|nr:hypothetical protein [Gemmataceae bacterium]